MVLPDGLLMEAEEKEQKEEDLSEQGLLSASWVLIQPCFLLGRTQLIVASDTQAQEGHVFPVMAPGTPLFFCLLNFQ